MNILQEEELKKSIDNFIDDYDPSGIEGQKYDFHLGEWMLKAEFKAPINILELPAEKRASAVIAPGETVFVLTREYLRLPSNISVTLAPKRKIGHDGIIILGGMRIDPGYHGQLFIGLYNFATQDFVLSPGRKIIAGIFTRHTAEVLFRPKMIQKNQFPEDLTRMISKYTPVNTAGLMNRLDEVESHLNVIQEMLNEDKNWRKEIRDSITEMNAALKEETLARKEHIIELKTQIEKEQIDIKNQLAFQEKVYKSKFDTNSRWITIMSLIVATIGVLFGFLK